MKIVVLGAGAWGTALAIAAATHPGASREVVLWARDAQQADSMRRTHENARYLPGVAFPGSLAIAHGPAPAVAHGAGLVIIASPVSGLRGLLAGLQGSASPVAWLCKGLEPAGVAGGGLMPHEICAQVAPRLRCGVLNGPSFAQEVARGQPTALVAASADAGVREALVAALHGPALRIYGSEDVVGVEVGGAVKNVLSIAAGLCDGLRLGLNARAALITRGLAEMTRLGVALGARTETFMGLSGLGDLVLTATGDLSRNRRVGLLLADGHTLQQAVDSLGHVAEGVYCARAVAQRAQALGVDMPIAQAVVALLDGRIAPGQAVAELMGRVARDESA